METKIFIPGSKSYTNRALVMASMTKGTVCLKNPLFSDDTWAMIECLKSLEIDLETRQNEILVHGDIHSIPKKEFALFARDSGTTIRFLLALLCMVPGEKKIGGSERLNDRPIEDLVAALRQLKAEIHYCGKEGQFPLRITSSSLEGEEVFLKGDVSSQFCSALLLIAPYLGRSLTIRTTSPLISKSYIDMTISCMQDAGIFVEEREDGHYFIPGNQFYKKREYEIEGDFSSAGYFFAIAVLTQSKITVGNLNPFSAQPDRKFLTFLERMGNFVTYRNNYVSIEGKRLLPVAIDMEDCPDQVMTMAVLMAFANGVSTISGVRSLRVKESERVEVLKAELGKMGIRVEDTLDSITIYGGSPRGAQIDTYNDHRIAMAFAVAGMVLPDIQIKNPEVVNKTFPTFWEVLKKLKGN